MAHYGFHEALKHGFVVASDPALDWVVVWNGSKTFNVYDLCTDANWKTGLNEVDMFTSDVADHEDAKQSAADYFARIYASFEEIEAEATTMGV
jgi:hypothetical protein